MKSAKFMSLALVAMLSSVVCAAPMSAPQISVVGIAVSDAPSATRQECLAVWTPKTGRSLRWAAPQRPCR
jgi:hypothetical protein